MLCISQHGQIAQVHHESIRTPAQDPLNLGCRKSASMEEHTCTNSQGMGRPAHKLFPIGSWVQAVGNSSNSTNRCLNVPRSKQEHFLGLDILIHCQRDRHIPSTNQGFKAMENSVHSTHEAMPQWVWIPSEQLLFTIVTILLGTEGNSHLPDCTWRHQ